MYLKEFLNNCQTDQYQSLLVEVCQFRSMRKPCAVESFNTMKDILFNMKVLNPRLLVLLLAWSPIAVVSSIGASAQPESKTDRASTHLQRTVDTINDKMIDAKVKFTSLIKTPPPRHYSQDRQPCVDFSHEKKDQK